MRKTGLKMRIISIILCFLMVFTSIPIDAFATETTMGSVIEDTQEEKKREKSEEEEPSETESVENSGGMGFDDLQIDEIMEDSESDDQLSDPADEENLMFQDLQNVSIKASFLAQWNGEFATKPLLDMTVSSDTAENYGFVDQTDSKTEVSTVDVLVAAHAATYGNDFTKETAGNYLVINGNFMTTIFNHDTNGNLCMLVNGEMPGSDGIEQATMKDGDILELFEYQVTSGNWTDSTQYTDKYLWLETKEGQKLDGSSLNGGIALELVVKGYAPFYAGNDNDLGKTTTISGADIYMVNMEDGSLTALNATSGEGGAVTVTIPKEKIGQNIYLTAKGKEMAMSLNKVTVTEPPATTGTTLSNLEVAVGGSAQESTVTQTLTPAFEGQTKSYTTPILDYQASNANRYVWVKVNAEESAAVTAQCVSSETVTLTSGEWARVAVKTTSWGNNTTYSGCLETGKYNTLNITVTADGQTETYTVTIPMQLDTSKSRLSWKTNLAEMVYCNPSDQGKVLSLEAQYENRPLDDENEITYQWYESTDGTADNGTVLEGQTGISYTASTVNVGMKYYYAVATCGEKTLTSKVIAVRVTEDPAPTSITFVCDYTHTIPDTWTMALGGVDYVAKTGEKLTLRALDQNGNPTPVQWPTSLYGGTLNTYTGSEVEYTITSTSNSWISVSSLYDSTLKSEEKALVVKDYSITTYNKNRSVILATDGQSVSNITTSGGISGYALWDYEMTTENIAKLTTDLSKKANSLSFQALRPGTITASFDLDLDGDGKGDGLTDTATLTINGIAVEDADGNLGKTYLETSGENTSPTVQLKALSSTENANFTWSSADETVATVDGNGLVTAKGVGSVIISAKDGTYTGGIKVVVTSADVPYFEALDFTTFNVNGTGLSNTSWKSTYFKPATLEYTGLKMTKAAADTLTFSANTLYDTEKWVATATYTDADGVAQSVAIASDATTALKNLPLETSIVTVTIASKTDENIQTVYTFEITRPRDTTKTIASGGIVFAPEGRDLWKDQYDNRDEGVMYEAKADGSFGQYKGVDYRRTYYRVYAMNALESFTLKIKGSTNFTHIRYSVDDGANWTYLGQTGSEGKKSKAITFPARGEDNANPVVKVTIQILDDATYTANVKAGKDGFADATPSSYYVWVEQIGAISAECDIVTAETPYGDWYPAFKPENTTYRLVTGVGKELPKMTYTVSEGATVYLGETLQTPGADGQYTLQLTEESQSIVVKASNGMTEKTYTIGAKAKLSDLYPDKVVDYLPVNSQYTNGSNGGYGIGPQQTLTGGLLSLGNFGGYVTFYYENGLTDDPSHPYGVDFYVDGNALVDTTTDTGIGFMEPGQVWISEDGNTWYALAGSEHYEDSTLWNYSVTYSKTETGGTTWVDNQGNTSASTHGRAFAWPDASIYTMNDLASKDSFTLTGVLIPCVDGTVAGRDDFNSLSKGVRFGYVDTLVNGTNNPYADNSDYKNTSSGFDLAWAVDGNGDPVDVSNKSFHYVKVVTASNLVAGAANEKSTEVASVTRVASTDTAVGETTAPEGVTFTSGDNSYVLEFEDDKQVYEVELPGMDTVSIQLNGTSESDNIYINNQRVTSGTAATGFVISDSAQRLIRIIVQNGEKEPVIYLLKVKTVIGGLKGSGTQENPWLLETPTDLETLRKLVATGKSFDGEYLMMTDNITLPADWVGIGCLIDPNVGHIDKGNNLAAFSGTLDGGGYTVTVPEGGQSLFAYVRGATVKNLNIYGKKIAGYGLVNHLEGVSLSGNAITIDNVTLKSGSATEKAGFIGTYITNSDYAGCSASFVVTIKNSKIEENVVVGYNADQKMIGSFAGRINGTIENCVSYATVKGTDYVGGILGTRDNAMGTCSVSNCQFYGTVEASGEHVGGILGGGYENSTAPNGYIPNITGCTVKATVTGKDKVGGILGGDSFVAQSWYAWTFSGNSFSGTVKATSGTYVGGAIGYLLSMNKFTDISDNSYVSDCGTNRGIGYVKYLDTSVENPTAFDGSIVIDTSQGTANCPTVTGCNWKANHNRTDDPLGTDADKLCKKVSGETPTEPTCYEIKATGTYKTEYTVGEELDLTGIVITAYWTGNKPETTLSLSDIEITGFDKNTVGKQTVTLSYGSVKTEISVTVKNKEGMISVTLSVLGDQAHDSDSDGKVHTLTDGNLITWAAAKVYTISSNTTAWELIKSVLDENQMTYSNPTGNYIEWITKDGVKLDQKANGKNSGWMFTVNGVHGLLGVSEQYMKTGDVLVLHYTDDYTKEKDNVAAVTAEEVIALINQLPAMITLGSKDAIEAARAAYTKLTESERGKVTNYSKLLLAEIALKALQQSTENLSNVYKTTKDYLSKLGTPSVGSIGGEWLVLGLARSGAEIPEGYFNNVVSYVKKNMDSKGRLHANKSTDNSRVILALTAAGYDPRNVGGYNLLEGLSDMDYVVKQGINGPIWALIALDCHNYEIPKNNATNPTTREKLIQTILKAQLSDGGWALSGTEADADLTGMALQALAPYYNNSNPDIMSAVNKAIKKLSSMQEDNGAFATVGTITSESTAQVIVALSALGIDADTDSRFIKNGSSAMDALLSFAVDGGGFAHLAGGSRDGMASEQGFYALTAYMRMSDGKNSLYDMSDITLKIGTVTDTGSDNDDKENNEKADPLPNAGNKDEEAAEKEDQAPVKDATTEKNSKKTETASKSENLTEEASALNELLKQVSDTSMLSELLEVIEAYEKLSAEEQALLNKENVIEELKERVGEMIHTDSETGIAVSGVEWNVQLVIEDILETTEIQEMQEKLGNNTMLVVWNISLVDLLTGEKVEPLEAVLVKIPLELLGDFSAYDGLAAVHYTKDGTAEYLNCTVIGDCIVFNTAEFSYYAIVGYHGTSPIEAATAFFGNAEESENGAATWIPWTIAGVCSAVLLAVLLLLINKNRKNAQAGE